MSLFHRVAPGAIIIAAIAALIMMAADDAQAAGGFVEAPTFSEQGFAQAVYEGGEWTELERAASLHGASGVWAQTANGHFELLVIGGPAFIANRFGDAFPDGFTTRTAVTLVRPLQSTQTPLSEGPPSTAVQRRDGDLRVDFDGVPEHVQRYTGGLGVGAPFIFMRDFEDSTSTSIPATTVQHGMDGSAPPMTHVVTDRRDLTFTARDHVMTHNYGHGGFQVISQTLGSYIHGEGAATVSVDISTAGCCARKWPVFFFYPKGSLPDGVRPGDRAFMGVIKEHTAKIDEPSNGIFFKPERFNGAIGWGGWTTSGAPRFGSHWKPIPVVESFTVRTPHKFVLDGRSVALYMGGTLLWTSSEALPASWAGSEIVVELQFVDYSSSKDGEPETTWHWDNVLISANQVFSAPGAGLPALNSTTQHHHP